ncbi:MAG: hypothetical protein FWD03_01670 [Defluviitaleaceae bacterium]|nr:hypothetical protein [Defluviitaleaceae bacterium]
MFAMREDLQKKFDAFWANKAIDGPVLYLFTEKAPSEKNISAEKKWTDLDYRLNRFNETDFTYYGDGYPWTFTNFGPGSLSACIGGDFIPAEHTIWFDQNPIIKDWDNLPDIRMFESSRMWQLMADYTRMLCENSNGRYHVSIADIGGTLDIISSLRGAQELLYDLYDYPEQVNKLIDQVNGMWEWAYNALTSMMTKYQQGTTTWFPIWSRGRNYTLQCDFCAMISPEMYRDFVHPHLKRQTEFLDNSTYHLDGAGQIPHLELMLTLPKLNAIQWVPGDGSPNVDDPCWYELYERIQKADKAVTFWYAGVDLDKYERLMKRLDKSKGIFISCHCDDEQMAKEMIRIAQLS